MLLIMIWQSVCFVDYLSHSSIWKNSLVIIVEDDAQNGPDHVDAHRSPAYIAGGYVKKGFVDHTAYTTASLLRTIELILGLPPMTQYDAPAIPLWRCMNNTPDHPAFSVRPCRVDLNAKNIAENIWQKKSEKFDFTKEDLANDAEFNEVIWKAVKGLDSPCPAPVHAAFFMAVIRIKIELTVLRFAATHGLRYKIFNLRDSTPQTDAAIIDFNLI